MLYLIKVKANPILEFAFYIKQIKFFDYYSFWSASEINVFSLISRCGI